jgi:hypothetical protein
VRHDYLASNVGSHDLLQHMTRKHRDNYSINSAICSSYIVACVVLRGEFVRPSPNHQPEEPGLCIYDPRRQGGPDISKAFGSSGPV